MSWDYDVVVSGGGPGGSTAAYWAARAGARVLVCDKARFPRDKPCGDGLTPRAVLHLDRMGLADELDRFHRVDLLKIVTPSGVVERRWPERKGLPRHGYVASRTEFDHLVLERAVEAGAELWEDAEVVEPVVEAGQVKGITVRVDGDVRTVRAPITLAADGMGSRLGRALGMVPDERKPFAVAVRAQVPSQRPEDAFLECYVTLEDGGRMLPGYGWVFPMRGGLVNVGIGYMSSYRPWKQLNINHVMSDFVASLPPEWELPEVPSMVRDRQLQGWRVPMGLCVWPPWRPGIMLVGDAVGAAKPFTGAGISKALESGELAAQTALEALAHGTASDLRAYEQRLWSTWGGYYRIGRALARAVGRPAVMRATVTSGVRVKMATDFFLTMFTGNGRISGARRVSERAVDGMVRVAQRIPEPAPGPEERTAVRRPPRVLERRPR